MNYKSKIVLFLTAVVLTACQSGTKKASKPSSGLTAVKLDHATGFKLWKKGNERLLKVYQVKGDTANYKLFKLVPRSEYDPNAKIQEIPVPCKRIVCLSSTQLTYFFALKDIDPIVGTNSAQHLFNKDLKARIEAGTVKRVGRSGHFNTELIESLNPDMIFVSPFKSGGYDVLKGIGIPLVPMGAYDEETPLGRAEWVKMIAAFIGKQDQADSIYNHIEMRYDSLKSLTAGVKHRPTVFSGKLVRGNWYTPGGASFYAHYFKDAGADYVVKNDKKAIYPEDFETVYARSAHADFWRLLVSEPAGFTKKALKAEDVRYADFDAFKNNKILMCNIRVTPYYEENAMKPDVILADYIHFFHPELLPGYVPDSYKPLN